MDFSPLSTHFKEGVITEIMEDNVYEKFFKVPEGGVVVDMGASVGLFTHSISPKKMKHIYCVEPHKASFKALSQNFKEHDNITFINKAITNKITKSSMIKGLYVKDSYQAYANNVIKAEAETTTFKSFIKDNNITTIDFFKCDAEGAEYSIFNEDNREWLLKNVKKVSGEWHLADYMDREDFIVFRELFLLPEHNYKAFDLQYNDITDKLWDDEFLHIYDDRDFAKGTQDNILSFNLYMEFDCE